ncbi:SMAD/FHA domain-containing protein [Phlegmacium glaucopus]|nr:SMAD/FHA domain-containing protein [Phlegmacium glaucopus]
MSKHSRSPQRRIRRDDDELRESSVHGYDSRKERANEGDRDYDSRARDKGSLTWDRGDKRTRRGDDRVPERDHRHYRERDREREQERDRDRYDRRNRDKEYGSSRSQRRSASPPSRTSRPRDVRSRSDSGSVVIVKDPSPVDKAKPNMAPSGLLAAETNTVKAVDGTSTVLKYNEPPEARKPALGWRLYVFKDGEQVELLHIHRQSAYLIGRDRLVADIAVDHPSCSKQHAAIQYRYMQEKDEFGTAKGVIKPFVIDLESTNGTFVNNDKEAVPAARYYELKTGDVIKFGLSTREYVILHDEV